MESRLTASPVRLSVCVRSHSYWPSGQIFIQTNTNLLPLLATSPSRIGEMDVLTKFCSASLKGGERERERERDHLGDLGVDGITILKIHCSKRCEGVDGTELAQNRV